MSLKLGLRPTCAHMQYSPPTVPLVQNDKLRSTLEYRKAKDSGEEANRETQALCGASNGYRLSKQPATSPFFVDFSLFFFLDEAETSYSLDYDNHDALSL